MKPVDLRLHTDLTIFPFVQIKRNEPHAQYASFRSVLSILSYLCKAPLVPHGAPVINSLFRQRAAIENILRACVGLPPNSHIAFEHRVSTHTGAVHTLSQHLIICYPFQFNLKAADDDQPLLKRAKCMNDITTVNSV